MKVKDIVIGMKVGRLTVLSRDTDKMHNSKNAYYLCQCDCGAICSVTAGNLGRTRNNPRGCNHCFRGESLIGMKFGKLLVLKYAGNKKTCPSSKTNEAHWQVKCDCGYVFETPGAFLRHGDIKQCSECKKNIGNKYTNAEGYVYVIVPHGDEIKYTTRPYKHRPNKIFEHIVIMAQHIGRPIDTRKESIHHKNGNKTDNRIDNLELKALYHGKGHSPFESIVANLSHLTSEERMKIRELLA